MMRTVLKIATGVLIISFLNITLFAQPGISGKYIAWNADTSNIVLLQLQKDSIGYHCTYQLPLGGIANGTAKNVRLRNDTLNIYLQQPVATISTVIAAKGQPTATVWIQNGQSTPLQIKPLLRPQTPQPPYTYLADSVEYDNADKSVHLGATFTRPNGNNKKYPVAILITGSGPEDRDETIFEHKPFAVIADYLTKNGIAVLRVDDRMKGKSRGEVMKATSADFAQDVLTSMRYLKGRNDVDTSRIGLIGHSEGGIISAIAYNVWPHFAFIVSLAGTGVPGSAILIRQQTDPVKGLVSKTAYDAYYQLVHQTFDSMEKYYGKDSLIAKDLAATFTTWQQQQPDSVLMQLNAKTINGEIFATSVKPEYANPWLKYFIHTSPAPYWQKVKCPVLALNGENDTQVGAVQNTTAIKAALQKGGNAQINVKVFPRLNHLFQHSVTGQLKEYPMIEETFSPEVLNTINTWLQKVIKK